MFTYLLLFIMFQSSTAAIYRLSDSDYARMPPLFHLDPYEACYDDPDALYCTVDLTLVSDRPSPLLTMIQEYSAHTSTHYNHTRLLRGICVTRTCRKFNKAEQDLRSTLEACVNESLYNKYNLKAKVSDGFDCSRREKYREIDFVDLLVAVICVIVVCANIVGSICDYWFLKEKNDGSLSYVFCFSIFRNWKELVASKAKDCDPRLQLRGLHGIRVLNICFVIIAHACMISFMLTENPEYIEDLFMSRPYHIFLNGTLIMQTFLMISSFLMVYNCLKCAEKHKTSWRMLPRLFLTRWLRLTPPYAIILALTATWFGRLTSGPLWKKFIFNEMSDCRRDWRKHLLYINNYFDNSECMGQSWYLAADTQLYCLAAVVFVTCRTPRARRRALSLLFLAGLIIPTVHTYIQDLDGVLIISPESIISVFMGNRSFNEVYKRGHTNLTGYVIGMAMAYLIYDWQKASGDPKSLQKYRFLVWLSFPLACLCCYSGSVFYIDAPPPPTYVHLLFAALMKPAFGILIGTIVVGVIIQVEGVYRGILEWPGWVTPSRLSFSAYLVHCALIRNALVMLQVSTSRTTMFNIIFRSFSLLLASYIAAFIFWMLVEAPFTNLVQEYLGKFKTKTTEGSQELDKGCTKRPGKELTVNESVNKIVAKMQ